MKYRYVAILWLLVLFTSVLSAQTKRLTNAPLYEMSASEFKQLAESNPRISKLSEYSSHKIKAYAVAYSTRYRGQEILASGAVLVPQNTDRAKPLVLYNHGTNFQKSRTPSLARNGRMLSIRNAPAVNGHITLIPDYIGYGKESEHLLHPYLNQELAATSIIDFVDHVVKLLDGEAMSFKRELFIFGHSQGGHATLSVSKALAEKPKLLDLKHIGSAVGGAPFVLDDIFRTVLNNDRYGVPGYIGATFASFNELIWRKPYEEFFQSPYAGVMKDYVKGELAMHRMAESLNQDLNLLFTNDFMNAIRSNQETGVLKSFAEHSQFKWQLKAPLYIYHGTRDQSVPYSAAQKGYDALRAIKGNKEQIKFHSLKGMDHGASGLATFLAVMEILNSQ